MKHPMITPTLLMSGLSLLLSLGVVSASLHAQTFAPVASPTVNNIPIQSGYFVGLNQSVTTYFNGQAVTTSGGVGMTTSGAYDAVAWFVFNGSAPPLYGIPAGWMLTNGGMGVCDPAYGNAWYIYIHFPHGPTPINLSGGTHCLFPSPYRPPIGWPYTWSANPMSRNSPILCRMRPRILAIAAKRVTLAILRPACTIRLTPTSKFLMSCPSR